MPSVYDCAVLSEDVYESETDSVAIKMGWKRLYNASASGNGFFAALYSKGDEYVIAFRGTEPSQLKDLLADFDMAPLPGFNSIPESQSKSALFFMDYCNDKTNNNVKVVTGHSLGGALAKVVSQKRKPMAIAFNAPYLGGLKGSVPMTSMVIHNYNSDKDPVSRGTDIVREYDGSVTTITIPPPPAWVTTVRKTTYIGAFQPIFGLLAKGAAETTAGLHYHSMNNLRIAIGNRNNLKAAIDIPENVGED